MSITDLVDDKSIYLDGMNGMFVDILPGDTEYIGAFATVASVNREVLPGIIRGILQDDVTITMDSSYTNTNISDMAATLGQGILGGVGKVANGAKTKIMADVLSGIIGGKGGADSTVGGFATTTGLGYGATGPGVVSGYKGSSIGDISIKLKWYMPGAELDVMRNVLLAIYATYPSQYTGEMKTFQSMIDNLDNGAGIKSSLGGIISNLVDIQASGADFITGVSSLVRIPPVLKLRISDWLTMSPMVSKRLTITMSRTTYDYAEDKDGFGKGGNATIRQLPVWISADMTLGYAQGQTLNGQYLNDRVGAESLSILGIKLAGYKPISIGGK